MSAHGYPLSTIHYPLSWHGLSLALPSDWSPVKIDGDARRGSIIVADLRASRLAIRWQTIKRPDKFDADAWARSAIVAEVGQLMLGRSTPLLPEEVDGWEAGRVFIESEPPGRDVWVGFHRPTSRAVEIVHQTAKLGRTLPDAIVRPLRFSPNDWSIFDLNCRVPDGWTLRGQRLNAGDLTLTFGRGRGRETLIVRQLAPATLALSRQPIERWLDQHARLWRKHYAGRKPIEAGDDRATRTFTRRRRFFFAHWLSPERVIIVSHDRARDRLVIADASTRGLAEATLATVT